MVLRGYRNLSQIREMHINILTTYIFRGVRGLLKMIQMLMKSCISPISLSPWAYGNQPPRPVPGAGQGSPRKHYIWFLIKTTRYPVPFFVWPRFIYFTLSLSSSFHLPFPLLSLTCWIRSPGLNVGRGGLLAVRRKLLGGNEAVCGWSRFHAVCMCAHCPLRYSTVHLMVPDTRAEP